MYRLRKAEEVSFFLTTLPNKNICALITCGKILTEYSQIINTIEAMYNQSRTEIGANCLVISKRIVGES
jgi:hypothetical protein